MDKQDVEVKEDESWANKLELNADLPILTPQSLPKLALLNTDSVQRDFRLAFLQFIRKTNLWQAGFLA